MLYISNENYYDNYNSFIRNNVYMYTSSVH